MLSFTKLGQYGRLGNQMFQYASLKGISENRKFNFYIPDDKHLLNKCFNLAEDTLYSEVENLYTFHEEFFSFDSDLFNYIPDQFNLFGYFQTEKYFLHITEKILKDFSFKKDIEQEAEQIMKNIGEKNVISVHVRRGDYLNKQDFHPVCSAEYYMKGIRYFGKKYKYLILSDDIEWCKNNLRDSNLMYISNNSEFIDLCLISKCEHNIISNSSFSWWGAWLNSNKDKKVIAPDRWFGSSGPQDTQDLLPKEWIKI